MWASFVAAYFADLRRFVKGLASCLAPGGWLALVEVDDLLGHEPREPKLAAELATFYAWARDHGGYGFTHGARLAHAMRAARLRVVYTEALADAELSFVGPAPAEVLDAWRERLLRMRSLASYFGPRREAVVDAILRALRCSQHRSLCEVKLVVGVR